MKNTLTLIVLFHVSISLLAQPKSLINKKDTLLYLPYENGKATFSYRGKMGVIDTAGRIIVPASFERLTSEMNIHGQFQYRFYWVKNKAGVLDKDFNILISPGLYDKIDVLIGGYFRVKQNEKFSFVDTTGKCMERWFDNAHFFNFGLAGVMINSKWGFINKTGELKIEAKFSEVQGFGSSGLSGFKQNELWGFIDTSGKVVIEPKYKEISFFKYRSCAVKFNNKWGFINQTDETIIPFQYAKAESFTGELALVKYHGYYGFININNEVVIPFIYRKANSFCENCLNTEVIMKGRWFWTLALTQYLCNFMRQIILIGFSTTGKSTLIKKIADKFPRWSKFDTDKEIAKDFGFSIANIYYAHKNLADTHKLILGKEEAVLNALTKASNNLIIAGGPGLPFRPAFANYIEVKKPHVVLIERPAEEIYQSLLDRRNDMKSKPEHQRPDFGIWDLDIMVKRENGILVDYSKSEAIDKIISALNQRQGSYNKFATFKIKSSDIFTDPLPQDLLDIL
jgi:shikimate kinase